MSGILKCEKKKNKQNPARPGSSRASFGYIFLLFFVSERFGMLSWSVRPPSSSSSSCYPQKEEEE